MSYSPGSYDPVPVEVVFPPPTRQNRFTIFFRILLVIPQFILLFFFGIAAFVAVIIGWFAALVLGRLPAGIDRFLGTYVQYTVRVSAYLYFLTGVWPPFDATTPSFPVHLVRSTQPLNRWAVLFRIFLALPVGIVAAAVGSGLGLLGFIGWVCAVVLGRLPISFHLGFAAVLRYQARYLAYLMLLTPTWPWGLFGDRDERLSPPGWVGPWPPTGAPPPPPAWSETPAPPSPASSPWARYPHVPASPAGAPVEPPAPPGVPTPAAPVDPYGMVSRAPEAPSVTRLVLTPGATVVVALTLAVGVFGDGANFAFGGVAGNLGSAVSNIELTVDYNHVSTDVHTWESRVQSCEAANDLACARRESQTLADSFGHFGDQIGSLHFPGRAAADAAALRQDAYRAQSELQAMAAASDATGFFLAARNFSLTADDIDTRYQAVEHQLTHRF